MKIRDETAELGSGSGQINPVKAVDPGLVYDLNMKSYIRFLCKQGYNSTSVALLVGNNKHANCSNFKLTNGSDGLNYPTLLACLIDPNAAIKEVFARTLTNVGRNNSVYKANVVAPPGLYVKVLPDTLNFTRLHQKLSFKVVVKGDSMKNGVSFVSGLLEWNNSEHSVKSPVLVYRNLFPV